MEHPILFLDLLPGIFKTHIPPHVTYTWLIMLILVGLGILASRQISLVPKGAQNVFELIIGGLEEFMVEVTGEEGRAFSLYLHRILVHRPLQPHRPAAGVFLPHGQY